jgi:hypothetical protein
METIIPFDKEIWIAAFVGSVGAALSLILQHL